MPRIDVEPDPYSWLMLQPRLGAALLSMADAVYSLANGLPLREREAARMRIAQLNECQTCQTTRDTHGAEAGLDEEFYANVAEWRTWEGFTTRERLAAEYAERFATDHRALRDDDDFWRRLRAAYRDDEIVSLAIQTGYYVMAGRSMVVLDVAQVCMVQVGDAASKLPTRAAVFEAAELAQPAASQ